jgi:hypothetical protein
MRPGCMQRGKQSRQCGWLSHTEIEGRLRSSQNCLEVVVTLMQELTAPFDPSRGRYISMMALSHA